MQKQLLFAFLLVVVGVTQATQVCLTLTPVRFFHASPDAPNVDVLVNDKLVWQNITFGTLTDYSFLSGQKADFKINVAGTQTTALNFTVDLSETPLTVAAVTNLSGIVFMDEDQPSNTTALVRIIHLSPDAPAVNVLARVQGRMVTLVEGLEFGQATDYTAVPPQCLDVLVTPTASPDTTVLEVHQVCLQSGKIYTASAIGLLNSTGSNKLQIKISQDVIPELKITNL